MKTSLGIALTLIGFGGAILAAGCQTQAKPTPTPLPTPTENVVVVVVTSTIIPTAAPTETLEPTITPLATFTPIGLDSPTPTKRASTTPIPIKTTAPKVTKAPDTPVPATVTPPADKYSAPTAITPKSGDSNSDGHDIQFYFGAVGPLGPNDCYQLSVQMVNPNVTSGGVAGDTFLATDTCGDQSPPGKPLKYVIYRPTFRNQRTYGTMENNAQKAGQSDLLKLQWYVTVVRRNAANPDGIHYDTTPLSPNSATLESDFHP